MAGRQKPARRQAGMLMEPALVHSVVAENRQVSFRRRTTWFLSSADRFSRFTLACGRTAVQALKSRTSKSIRFVNK